jgi:hypothetical protein
MVELKQLPWINLLHILIIAPFLLYIGINRRRTPDSVFMAMGIMGAGVFLFHSYLTFGKLKKMEW